jgi:hypothetical protein
VTRHRVVQLDGQPAEGDLLAPWLRNNSATGHVLHLELEEFLDAMSERGYELVTIHYNMNIAYQLAVFRDTNPA